MLGIGLGLSLGSNLGGAASAYWYTLGKADDTDPSFWADFANNRYAVNGSEEAFSDIFTFTRSTTGTYFDANGVMQTAAINTPRFDHDPVTGAAKGLLVEGQRTNLIFNSSLPYTTWISVAATITAAPTTFLGHFTDGATVASQGGSWNRIQTNNVISWTAGKTYAWTAFVKGGTSGNVRFVFRNESLTNESSVSGVIGGLLPSYVSTAGTVTVNTPIPVQGGYIYSGTFVPAVNSSNARLACGPYSNVAGETVHVYGFQFEEGAFPSSYIPTSGSSVTRAADIVKNTPSNTVKFADWYNQSAGTVVCAYSTYGINTTATQNVYNINDATASNSVTHYVNNDAEPSNSAFEVKNAAVNVFQQHYPNRVNTGALERTALAYKADDFSCSVNGLTPLTDTSGSLPTLTQINLANRAYNDRPLYGYIKDIRYYPIRVSNSEMQRITS